MGEVRTTITIPRRLLANEYAAHLPQNEDYRVAIDVPRADDSALITVWRQVKDNYGQYLDPKWRETFVLAREGGVRLNPTSFVRDGDTIEICQPLPWEESLWHDAASVGQRVVGNALALATSQPCSVPVTPTQERVRVPSPSRSALRAAKKRKLKEKQSSTQIVSFDSGQQGQEQEEGGIERINQVGQDHPRIEAANGNSNASIALLKSAKDYETYVKESLKILNARRKQS